MNNQNLSNKRIKLNNNSSKPAKQVVSSNKNGGAVSIPLENAVLLGRTKLSNSSATKLYQEEKRKWCESLDQSLTSKAEIGKTFFRRITNQYKWQFWKQEAEEWRMLNDSEVLRKVQQDVRMMKIKPHVAAKCNADHSCYLEVLRPRLRDCEASSRNLPKIGKVVLGQHVKLKDQEGNRILRALVLDSKSYYKDANQDGKNKCVNTIRGLMEECGANFEFRGKKPKKGKPEDWIYTRIRQRFTDCNKHQRHANSPERQANTLPAFTIHEMTLLAYFLS